MLAIMTFYDLLYNPPDVNYAAHVHLFIIGIFYSLLFLKIGSPLEFFFLKLKTWVFIVISI